MKHQAKNTWNLKSIVISATYIGITSSCSTNHHSFSKEGLIASLSKTSLSLGPLLRGFFHQDLFVRNMGARRGGGARVGGRPPPLPGKSNKIDYITNAGITPFYCFFSLWGIFFSLRGYFSLCRGLFVSMSGPFLVFMGDIFELALPPSVRKFLRGPMLISWPSPKVPSSGSFHRASFPSAPHP